MTVHAKGGTLNEELASIQLKDFFKSKQQAS